MAADDDTTRAKQIAKTAKMLRKKAGLSQPEAAERSGVNLERLREFEQGQRVKVDVVLLEELGRAYGYPADVFLRVYGGPTDAPDPDPALRRQVWYSIAPDARLTKQEIAEIQTFIDEKNASAIRRLRKGKQPSGE